VVKNPDEIFPVPGVESDIGLRPLFGGELTFRCQFFAGIG